MKVGFKVKYGYNEIEIPITEKTVPKFQSDGRTELFNKKVTVYNSIPKDGVNERRFSRFVADQCNIQGGIVEQADGTIANITDSKTVITKDVLHYLPPVEYFKLPADMLAEHYTASVDDFIVFGEVDDVVTTSSEFSNLRKKYKNNGISITAVNEYIYGTALDNIQMVGG